MKTILIVDDNPEWLLCFGELLSIAGYKIITCKDGQTALAVVYERSSVDLIITDYSMPGMTGLELVAKVKKLSPQIPVIMCSAHLRSDIYSKAISLGVVEYLQKPVGTDDLKRVVSWCLRMPPSAPRRSKQVHKTHDDPTKNRGNN